jgi:ABC-2 type transport system ATP-binding protein
VGTPAKLKSTVSPGATLEDVFRHYAASDLSEQPDSPGSFREIRFSRKVASRAS